MAAVAVGSVLGEAAGPRGVGDVEGRSGEAFERDEPVLQVEGGVLGGGELVHGGDDHMVGGVAPGAGGSCDEAPGLEEAALGIGVLFDGGGGLEVERGVGARSVGDRLVAVEVAGQERSEAFAGSRLGHGHLGGGRGGSGGVRDGVGGVGAVGGRGGGRGRGVVAGAPGEQDGGGHEHGDELQAPGHRPLARLPAGEPVDMCGDHHVDEGTARGEHDTHERGGAGAERRADDGGGPPEPGGEHGGRTDPQARPVEHGRQVGVEDAAPHLGYLPPDARRGDVGQVGEGGGGHEDGGDRA